MVPIEWLMLTLLLSFAVVGIARQFPRELGVTIVFTGMLLAFDLAGTRIGSLSHSILSKLGFQASLELVSWWVYSIIILTVVVVAYAGETLSFSGVWAPGRFLAKAFDVFIGLFNGWLVVGTWWFLSNSLGYPSQIHGMYVPPLSPLATELVQWTPMAIIPEPSYVFLAAFLLLLLGLKVIR